MTSVRSGGTVGVPAWRAAVAPHSAATQAYRTAAERGKVASMRVHSSQVAADLVDQGRQSSVLPPLLFMCLAIGHLTLKLATQ